MFPASFSAAALTRCCCGQSLFKAFVTAAESVASISENRPILNKTWSPLTMSCEGSTANSRGKPRKGFRTSNMIDIELHHQKLMSRILRWRLLYHISNAVVNLLQKRMFLYQQQKAAWSLQILQICCYRRIESKSRLNYNLQRPNHTRHIERILCLSHNHNNHAYNRTIYRDADIAKIFSFSCSTHQLHRMKYWLWYGRCRHNHFICVWALALLLSNTYFCSSPPLSRVTGKLRSVRRRVKISWIRLCFSAYVWIALETMATWKICSDLGSRISKLFS